MDDVSDGDPCLADLVRSSEFRAVVAELGQTNVPIFKEERAQYVWFAAMVQKDGTERYTTFVDEMTKLMYYQ